MMSIDEINKTMQQQRKQDEDRRIRELRRELNEIEQMEQDDAATKYDRLRKIQLERDYNELLNPRR